MQGKRVDVHFTWIATRSQRVYLAVPRGNPLKFSLTNYKYQVLCYIRRRRYTQDEPLCSTPHGGVCVVHVQEAVSNGEVLLCGIWCCRMVSWQNSVFWDETPCSDIRSHGLHGAISQKIVLFMQQNRSATAIITCPAAGRRKLWCVSNLTPTGSVSIGSSCGLLPLLQICTVLFSMVSVRWRGNVLWEAAVVTYCEVIWQYLSGGKSLTHQSRWTIHRSLW
jgi:hypothetical protein